MKPSLYVFGLLVCCAGGVLQERQRSKAETDVINGLPAFTDVDDLMAKLRVQHPNYNRHRGNSIKELSSKNLCYCTDEGACDRKDTCFKEADAACFHAQEQVLNREKGRMETWHIYGCAPKERGSNGSHLTCNGYRSHHSRPFTIGCCYEGNYCNRHVVPSPYANGVYAFGGHESGQLRSNYAWVVEILIVGMVFATLSTFAILSYRKFYLPNTKKGCGSDLPTLDFLDLEAIEKESLLFDMSSGLGCGQAVLNRRNVAMQLELGEVVGRGRYGEVRKAAYRGRTVAVKTFYTTEEDSWRNERAIYETNMLNHDNILQFVAADISSVDSMTQMLLITDFCEYGSLYDYLRSGVKITLEEAIKLAYTSICGVEHLHCPVIGTENRNKPEIAHRDIKTKNVIVKRPGVCCIADFGLAVQYKDELTPKNVKVRVGTKRYMSPEVLTDTLNVANFDNFKLSDIYAFSLLLWEILVHLSPESDSHSVANTTSSGLNSLEKQNSFKKEKNKPVQYYHVNEIDHKNANLHQNQPTEVNSGDNTNTSSGVGTSIASDHEFTERKLPFERDVKPDPTFDEMIDVVCTQKRRPQISQRWTDKSNPAISSYCVLMSECWSEKPANRHTALKIKITLDNLLKTMQEERSKMQSRESAECSNDSGVRGLALPTNS